MRHIVYQKMLFKKKLLLNVFAVHSILLNQNVKIPNTIPKHVGTYSTDRTLKVTAI